MNPWRDYYRFGVELSCEVLTQVHTKPKLDLDLLGQEYHFHKTRGGNLSCNIMQNDSVRTGFISDVIC